MMTFGSRRRKVLVAVSGSLLGSVAGCTNFFNSDSDDGTTMLDSRSPDSDAIISGWSLPERGEWPMTGNNASRTFSTSTEGLRTSPSVDWEVSLPEARDAEQPLVRAGRLYSARGQQMISFNAETGEEQWSVPILPRGNQLPQHTVVSDDMVFTEQFGLSESNNEKIWERIKPSYTDIYVEDGVLVAAKIPDIAVQIDPKSGQILYEYGVEKSVARDGIIYGVESNTDDRIVGLDATTGNVVFETSVELSPYGLMLSDNVLCGVFQNPSSNNDVYYFSFDISSGERLCRQDIRTEINNAERIAVSNDSVYIAGDNLYSIDLYSGDKRWEFSTNDDIYYKPIASRNQVYICTSSSVVAVSSSGQKQWEVDISSGPIATPCVSKNKIYVASREGVACLS